MTNILIPLAYYLVVVGRTINIADYGFGVFNWPIYNETDVVENPLSSFNASYYVLPDENIPYEKVRVPIDYLLRTKYEGNMSSKKNWLNGYRQLTSKNVDNALVLLVAEYKTSEQTVKEGTNPTANWQDHIRDRDHQTHYAEKLVYGSQVISLVRLRSLYQGDVQVFRRILKDVMGTSGSLTADTVELWKKAEKAIRESPDIRGEIFIDHYTNVISAQLPAINGKIENLFRHVSELPKYKTSRDKIYYRPPLYVSFKPLHDLDERYPVVQKDVEGERYLTHLYRLLGDVDAADSELRFILRLISDENEKKFRDFRENLSSVTAALDNVFYTSLSSYETIDKAAFKEAFKQYEQGLDNSTVNYLAQFRRLWEQMATGIRCGREFYSPTSGMLRVLDNEVVRKGKVDDFEKCIDFCVTDDQCRAVGYSDQECLVYYRSTNTAVITPSRDMKIYDRKCSFIFREDK